MKKKTQVTRAESDTGDVLLITHHKIITDPIGFWKVYTETVSKLCSSPEIWGLPLGFIIWILKNTNFDGELRKSKSDFERETGCSHDRAFRLFALAEKHELIFKIGQIGTTHRWGVNPKFFHRGDPKTKTRNANHLKSERFHYLLQKGEIDAEQIESDSVAVNK